MNSVKLGGEMGSVIDNFWNVECKNWLYSF